MRVSFPAMKGTIGQRTYYACLMKLSAIPKMFTFRDWAEFTPEDREQRILNKNRVPVIAKYIIDNEDGYLFSSITASYKCDVVFNKVDGSGLGILEMEFEEANFVINDGQHRAAAIAYAIKENPALGEETISVLLFPYESRERVQQMFSDLNRFVAKTSKSLDILFDKRDPLSTVTLEVCERVPVFKGMVDKDAISLPVRSAKLFSLSALYDANEELLKFHRENDASHNEMVNVATDFWSAVAAAIPDWEKVKNGYLPALELRQEKISSHAVVLRAMGGAGSELMREDAAGWKSRLMELTKVDWSKKNRDWENICIIANSVVSNRQARLATRAYLKRHLALTLNESEERALKPAASPASNIDTDSTARLTPEEKDLLKTLLPRVVKKFDPNAVAEEGKRAFDAYFGLPDEKDKYAGMQIDPSEPLCWYVQESYVPTSLHEAYQRKAGYTKMSGWFWKYIPMPAGFMSWTETAQEAWLTRRIEGLLLEDSELRK